MNWLINRALPASAEQNLLQPCQCWGQSPPASPVPTQPLPRHSTLGAVTDSSCAVDLGFSVRSSPKGHINNKMTLKRACKCGVCSVSGARAQPHPTLDLFLSAQTCLWLGEPPTTANSLCSGNEEIQHFLLCYGTLTRCWTLLGHNFHL